MARSMLTMQNNNSIQTVASSPEVPEGYSGEGIPQVVRPVNQTGISTDHADHNKLIAYRLDWLLIMFVSFVVVVVAISGLKRDR